MEEEEDVVSVQLLPFAPSVLNRLVNAGFKFLEDFRDVKVLELSRECDIVPEVALSVLKHVKSCNFSSNHPNISNVAPEQQEKKEQQTNLQQNPQQTTAKQNPQQKRENEKQNNFHQFVKNQQKSLLDINNGETALQLLLKSSHLKPITTLCKPLDEILKGGVHLGTLTEVCGVPGAGKTQIMLQLAVNVQIPKEFSGLEGEVLYLDTENSVTPERLASLAKGVIHYCRSYAKRKKTEQPELVKIAENMSVEALYKKIGYYRILNNAELMSMITVLPSTCTLNPNIKLIIIDSITAHFRHDFGSDFALRSRILQGISTTLKELATQMDVAVVITNQVTTKMENGVSFVTPSLGDSWSHVCANRLLITRKNVSKWCAYLTKSMNHVASEAEFVINSQGLHDC